VFALPDPSAPANMPFNGDRMPQPPVQVPDDFGWTPGPDVPFTPIQCPPGFYISGDHCQMVG
jgi:hypothetical protein